MAFNIDKAVTKTISVQEGTSTYGQKQDILWQTCLYISEQIKERSVRTGGEPE